MERKKNIEEQIGAYLAGELSLIEQKSLEQWRNENSHNQKLFRQFEDIWKLKRVQPQEKKDALDKLTKRILEHESALGKKLNAKHNFKFILRIAAGLLILTTSYFLLRYVLDDSGKMTSPSVITKQVPYGKKLNLTMPDGSKIYLNAGSELAYFDDFGNENRNVRLTGEAYFEVVSSELPFVITLQDHEIKVLGTSFNVKSEKETCNIETIVVTGKVAFTSKAADGPQNQVEVNPGEKLYFQGESNKIEKTPVTSFEEISWKDGIIIFKNDPMKTVFKELEKWYGVQFNVSHKQILDCNLTAKFDNESLEDVLNNIDVIIPLDYDFDNDNKKIHIDGRGCYELSPR